jgi:endonuclease IV
MGARQSRAGRQLHTFLLPPCSASRQTRAPHLLPQLRAMAIMTVTCSSRQRKPTAGVMQHISQHQTRSCSSAHLQQAPAWQAAGMQLAMVQTVRSSRQRSPSWTSGHRQVQHLAETHADTQVLWMHATFDMQTKRRDLSDASFKGCSRSVKLCHAAG